MVKVLVLFAVVGCGEAKDPAPTAPTAPADPWAGSGSAVAAPADDPWKEAPGESIVGADPTVRPPPPPPPPSAQPATNDLAGTYQCQTIRHGIAANGMRQSSYVPSALGVFEISANGTYRSASYASKGEGRARGGAGTMTFEGGPYAGYHGETGSNSTGFFIRISGETPTAPPKPSLQFNDHMCFR